MFEYHLVLTPPNVGDDIDHVVTILAWDDEGNSTFRKLILPYHRVGEGDENGSIHISIDATTLGLGIIISICGASCGAILHTALRFLRNSGS